MNFHQIREALQAGQTLQEIMGISQERMEQFYQAAYNLFQAGKESQAADAFFFLTALNPAVHVYWVALGMVEQALHHYQEALSAYAMSSLTGVEDPLPYYHSAACYYALQDQVNMQKSLEMAIEYFADIPEHATMKETALRILSSV